METKEVLFELRTKRGLSQEELAARLGISRQAVRTDQNDLQCLLRFCFFFENHHFV